MRSFATPLACCGIRLPICRTALARMFTMSSGSVIRRVQTSSLGCMSKDSTLPEGGLLFDGGLYGGALGTWFSTDFTARNPINLTHKQYDCGLLAAVRATCPLDVPAFTGKVMTVSSETDAVLGGFLDGTEPSEPAFQN